LVPKGQNQGSAFVPEGLGERCLAVYCLGLAQKRGSSRRDGMIWFAMRFGQAAVVNKTLNRYHTVPFGTDLLLDVFLAMNCQATIASSLRDKNLYRVGRLPEIPMRLAHRPRLQL
jgi:hypothetical protein